MNKKWGGYVWSCSEDRRFKEERGRWYYKKKMVGRLEASKEKSLYKRKQDNQNDHRRRKENTIEIP